MEHNAANGGDLTDLLRAAYQAGYDHGADDEAYDARGVGPQYRPGEEPASFEKWLRDVGVTSPAED